MKDWLKKNSVTIVSILLNILLATIGILLVSHYKNKARISEHNYQTAIGEISFLTTKNGELVAERDSYVASAKDLEKLNISNKDEIKRLEKALDKHIEYIAALESEIKIQPDVIHDTVVVSSGIIRSTWGSGDEWYSIRGRTVVIDSTISTTVDNLHIVVPLKVGLTDSWSVFVNTSNPYVKFSSIDGALLNKNLYTKTTPPRRWGLGISAGIGCGYDLIGRSFYTGPGIQIGLYYRLF